MKSFLCLWDTVRLCGIAIGILPLDIPYRKALRYITIITVTALFEYLTVILEHFDHLK